MNEGSQALATVVFVLCALCGTAAGFSAVTLLGLYLLNKKSKRIYSSGPWPAIVLLRPCEGAEPFLEASLLSSVTAAYLGKRRVLVLVPSKDDPAYGVALSAQRLAQEAGAPPIEVLVSELPEGASPLGENRKVAQLLVGLSVLEAGAVPLPEDTLILQADSDVHLSDQNLPELVTALSQERVGAAFAPPVEEGGQTLGDWLSCAVVGASHQSFRALYGIHEAIGTRLGGAPSLAGALCGYRRSALQTIGGLAPLRSILGEDNRIAESLVASGYEIAMVPSSAHCKERGRSLSQSLVRVARWLTVVRAQRPGLLLSYPLFLAATPLHLALALFVVADPRYLFMVFVLLCLRATLAMVLLRQNQTPEQGRGFFAGLGRNLCAEVLLLAGFARALLSRRILWRGHPFVVKRGGVLIHLPSRSVASSNKQR